jgi:hypothetical protein
VFAPQVFAPQSWQAFPAIRTNPASFSDRGRSSSAGQRYRPITA